MRMKKILFGKSDMNLGDLAQWCDEDNKVPGPELPNEPFIVFIILIWNIVKFDNTCSLA